jgi:hypothetical protein
MMVARAIGSCGGNNGRTEVSSQVRCKELFKAADPRVAQSSGTMIASAVVLTAVAGLAAIEVAAIASRLDACARPPIAPAVLARSC